MAKQANRKRDAIQRPTVLRNGFPITTHAAPRIHLEPVAGERTRTVTARTVAVDEEQSGPRQVRRGEGRAWTVELVAEVNEALLRCRGLGQAFWAWCELHEVRGVSNRLHACECGAWSVSLETGGGDQKCPICAAVV